MVSLPDFGLAGSSIASFGAASGDLITQGGYYAAAQGYTKAGNMENLAGQDTLQQEKIAAASGGIQIAQAKRQLYQSVGSTEAAAGGAGLKLGGSIASVVRSSIGQGALQQAIIGANTQNTIKNLDAQAQGEFAQAQGFYSESSSATAQGNAAGAASGTSNLMGMVAGVGAVAAMFL